MSENKHSPDGLFSRDAEQSVLGGLMLDNECWDEVLLLVSSDDFYYGVHRTIFREMARLINAGKPIDLITLSDSLENQNEKGLEKFGGFAYLAELSKNTPALRISSPTVKLWRSTARQDSWPVSAQTSLQLLRNPGQILPKLWKTPSRKLPDLQNAQSLNRRRHLSTV
jgi:hypothetical protein